MKIAKTLTLTIAAAGLVAFAAPAHAQMRGGNRGGGHPGGAAFNRGGGAINRGDRDRGRDRDDRFRRVVFFGGGWGWGWGWPYWGYPYGYPYGYYYPPPYPYYQGYQGQVYEGQPAPNYRGRTTNDGGKDTSSLTRRVQQRLARDGYYHGEIDGVIGEGTRRAIRNYERDNGLPVTGEIGRQLLETMGVG